MNVTEIVSELEKRTKAAGARIDDVCRQANVHPSTFYRWKKGEVWPSSRLLSRMEDAVVAAESQKAVTSEHTTTQ